MSKSIVLWNKTEAKEKCAEFVKDYAQLRQNLLDHLDHKGHVALGFKDDWDGFYAYCRDCLKLELHPKTIRLQIDAAQLSREVGTDVPMVITKQLQKLPEEKRAGTYAEVVTAREVAGQRTANQMAVDVGRVVKRELKQPAPPSLAGSGTFHSDVEDDLYPVIEAKIAARNGVEAQLPPQTPETPQNGSQGPRKANLPVDFRQAYTEGRKLLRRFVTAFLASNQQDLTKLCIDVDEYLRQNG